MKKLRTVLCFSVAVILTSCAVRAQTRCATAYVDSLTRMIRPEHRVPPAGFRTRSGPAPVVGAHRSFWFWDFSVMPPGARLVDARCLAVTGHAYIFVETSIIDEAFPPATLDAIVTAFEESCPGDPNRGILDIDCEIFGDPPDAIDHDPRVYFLYADFAQFGHQAFDGYFNSFDQVPDEVAWQNYHQHSNEVDMLYLNGKGGQGPASEYMLSVLAHEFQHLIHYNYDQQEASWINEAMSEAAMTACGYYTDTAHLAHFCHNPAVALVDDEHPHYGAVLLFGTYLLEQFGPDFLGRLVACPETGIAGVEATLKDVSFDELFNRWSSANGAAGRLSVTTGPYGYKSFTIPPVHLSGELGAYGRGFDLSIPYSGAAYFQLSSKPVSITVSDTRTDRITAGDEFARRTLLFRRQNGALKPMLFTLVKTADESVKFTEIQEQDGVYSLPAGPGLLVINTMNAGGASFTIDVLPAAR